MSEKSTNSLETVSTTFSLERHNFEEYLNQQRAYQAGVEEFATKFSKIPEPLFQNLQHEAGLAEVYFQKGELLKYSIHLYRQLEILYNSIFGIENSDLFPFETEKLERIKNVINWDDCISQLYNFYAMTDNVQIIPATKGSSYQNKIKSGDLICSVSDNSWDPSKNSVNFYQRGQRFYFNFDKTNFRFQKVADKKSKDYVQKLQNRLQDIINKKPFGIEFSQREFMFKNIFYFAGSPKSLRPVSIQLNEDEKVYLNAFVAIRYFRNLGSHNNFDNQTLSQKGFSLRLDNSERKYWENPELILKSNYFQQYLNMVYHCYIEHLVNPYF